MSEAKRRIPKLTSRSSQIRSQAEAIGQTMKRVSDGSSGMLTVRAGDDMGQAPMFPAQFVAPDKRSTLFSNKRAIQSLVGGQGGTVMYGDEDAHMVDRMDKMKQRADFHVWLDQLFDTRNPAVQRYVESWYPEYTESRLQVGYRMLDIQKQLMQIKLRGIQSKGDAELLYACSSGYIPKTFLQRPPHLMDAVTLAADGVPAVDQPGSTYERGLFNPYRYASTAAGTPYLGFFNQWPERVARIPVTPAIDFNTTGSARPRAAGAMAALPLGGAPARPAGFPHFTNVATNQYALV